MKDLLKNSERMLNLLGNIIAIVSSIAMFVIINVVLFEDLNSPWLVFFGSAFSYILMLGIAYSFKVLSNISKKLDKKAE